jgi:hypothetical protein
LGFNAPAIDAVFSGDAGHLIQHFFIMNKLTISQIRQKSALYYAVGITLFSSFFVVIAVIAQLISSNS